MGAGGKVVPKKIEKSPRKVPKKASKKKEQKPRKRKARKKSPTDLEARKKSPSDRPFQPVKKSPSDRPKILMKQIETRQILMKQIETRQNETAKTYSIISRNIGSPRLAAGIQYCRIKRPYVFCDSTNVELSARLPTSIHPQVSTTVLPQWMSMPS